MDILKSHGNVMSIHAECGDRVSQQFSSILNEDMLFFLDEIKYSLYSFNIGGFIGYFVSPFQSLTDKTRTFFDQIESFISNIHTSVDGHNGGDWIGALGKVLDLECSSLKIVFMLSQINDGWLKSIRINLLFHVDQRGPWVLFS